MSELSVAFAKNFLVLCNLMLPSGVMTFELSIPAKFSHLHKFLVFNGETPLL